MIAPPSETALDIALGSLRVACSFVVTARFAAPWGVAIAPEGMSALHYVAAGSCVLSADGEPARSLREGDYVWMPRGLRRTLGDRPGRSTVPLADVVRIGHAGGSAVLELGGKGARARVIGAGVRLEGGRWESWRSELPRLFVFRPERALRAILRSLAEGTGRCSPASRAVTMRMVELASLLTLETLIADRPRVPVGWLAALEDRHLGPALARMHEQPRRPWSVADLAKAAGLGRSSFARRFSSQLGESPAAYLATVRLERAHRSLVETDRTLDEIAADVGYASAPALAHAYKRHFGVSPGSHRRARRGGARRPAGSDGR